MRLLVSGADQEMGAALCEGLAARHQVSPIGVGIESAFDLGAASDAYRSVDLMLPPSAQAATRAIDMVIHAQAHHPPADKGESALLEQISRSTYVLVQAAVDAGIGRIVLISDIRLFDAVPEEYAINAGWQPRPAPDAVSLAPYLAELTCREIARVGKIEAVNLRMGALDAVDGTSAADAVDAVERALAVNVLDAGYHWFQQHIVSGGRFASQWSEPWRR